MAKTKEYKDCIRKLFRNTLDKFPMAIKNNEIVFKFNALINLRSARKPINILAGILTTPETIINRLN